MSGAAIRAFVAVGLPDGHRDALERLMEGCPAARPVDPDTYHVTLAFLDAQPPAVLEALDAGLRAIARADARVTIDGLGTFGRRAPLNLHAAVAPDPGLSALRDRVRGAAHAAGIVLPRERFRPHVTLARPRGSAPSEARARLAGWIATHGAFRLPPVPVDRIGLYRSTLTPAGARHDILADYAVA